MLSRPSTDRSQGSNGLLGRLSSGWQGAKGKAHQAGEGSAKYAKVAAVGATGCALKGAGAVKAGMTAGVQAASHAIEEAHEMGGAVVDSVRRMGRAGGDRGSRFSSFVLDRARVDSSAFRSAGFGLTNPFAAAYRLAKVEGQTKLLDMGAYGRAKVMFGLGCAIKSSATADPDMTQFAKSRVIDVIDVFWNDITIYNEQMYEDRRNALRNGTSRSEDLGEIGVRPCCLSPWWWRARVLYHLHPYDKSIFGKVKDPAWWVLATLALLPMRGIRISFFAFLLLLVVTAAPPDKFQLVRFIIGLKGSQFISSGMIQAWTAGIKYYLCVRPHGVHTCATDGPGADQNVVTGLMDLFGSTMLSWLAFLFLPCSVRSAGLRTVADEEGEEENKAARRHGGRRRLVALLVYDIVCFCLSCGFGIWLIRGAPRMEELKSGRPWEDSLPTVSSTLAVLGKDAGTWEGRSAIFWARVLYAFTSWPFVLLLVPGLSTVLTHTRQTGFNKNGVCVPYMLPKVKQEDDV